MRWNVWNRHDTGSRTSLQLQRGLQSRSYHFTLWDGYMIGSQALYETWGRTGYVPVDVEIQAWSCTRKRVYGM